MSKPKFPGWRTMTGAQRRNAKMDEIFDRAKVLKRQVLIEAVQNAQGRDMHTLTSAMDALEAYEESQGRRFKGFPEVLREHYGAAP